MDTTILKLEHNKTETTPTWGGTRTNVEYDLYTTCEGIKNHYVVTAEIRGIATADLYLQFQDAKATTNNEHTLISSAIEDLLNW